MSVLTKREKSDNLPLYRNKLGGNLSKNQVSARLITKISLHTHESDLFSVAIFYLVLQLEDYTPLEDEAIYWHQYLRQAQQPKFLILNSTAILDFCNICRNLYLPWIVLKEIILQNLGNPQKPIRVYACTTIDFIDIRTVAIQLLRKPDCPSALLVHLLLYKFPYMNFYCHVF